MVKILENIPQGIYQYKGEINLDYDYILKYLRENKTFGDEKNVDYNGIFHVHWRGPIDTDKVIFKIKSILATQEVSKIFFWIENNLTTMMSPGYPKLMQFRKYIDIKVFDKSVLDLAQGDQANKDMIWNYFNRNHPDRRYKTDILRWVVTSIYGGVYSDMDTLFLRDIRDIKINNWCSKWGSEPYAEACILKLEKGSNIYEQMYLNNKHYQQCFLLIVNSMPEAFNYKYDNLNFVSLPHSFFDIMWRLEYERPIDGIKFDGFQTFFEETERETTIDNFLKGCFTFHWHNNWGDPELKKSYAGRLNENMDRIIEEKYNIKPIKIFQS